MKWISFNSVFLLSWLALSFTAQGTEDLERLRKRCRRNSDSSLYCKARDEAPAQSKGGAETKHLDFDKNELLQRYLQDTQETHSITTETTDSGIITLGEPSDIEMQDISGKYHLLIRHCLGSQILNTEILTKKDVNSAGYRASASCYNGDNNCLRIVIPYEPYRLMPQFLLNFSNESYDRKLWNVRVHTDRLIKS